MRYSHLDYSCLFQFSEKSKRSTVWWVGEGGKLISLLNIIKYLIVLSGGNATFHNTFGI